MTNDEFAAMRSELVAQMPPEKRPADDEELAILLTRCERAAEQGIWLVKADGAYRRPSIG